ncbi:MAG: FtsQ-type POTRA domain-containing protein [Nitrospinae bacterium]|nr:FtsQ-type POTRA domain-containing protein [Nitrospinota bacterium]MBF0633817.1 FtsQ-type POTRA domain-containing protein [Nitrospinota bacterium]
MGDNEKPGRRKASKKPDKARKSEGWGVTSWLKYLSAAMGFILLALGANVGYEAAVKERYFDVTDVKIEGLSAASESHIRELIGPVEGRSSLAIDMREIGERLVTDPWVENVDMRRELPSTLVVVVRERVPAFIAVFGSKAWMMDGKGTLIEAVDNPEQMSMPLLAGAKIRNGARPAPGAAVDRAVADFAVMALDKLGGYKLMGRHSLMGFDFAEPGAVRVLFKGTEALVRLPVGKWTDEVERLVTVDHILRAKGGQTPSLSLLFSNKVIAAYPDKARAVIGGGEGNG